MMNVRMILIAMISSFYIYVKMRRYQICECRDSMNDSNTAVIPASTCVIVFCGIVWFCWYYYSRVVRYAILILICSKILEYQIPGTVLPAPSLQQMLAQVRFDGYEKNPFHFLEGRES